MRQNTNHERRTTNHGFTLIEILVVFSILTVIMGIAFTAIRLNETYRDLTFIRIQLYRQNKRAHDAIREELEKSQASRADIMLCITCYNPWQLYFQIPLINSINSTTYDVPWGARYNNTDYVNGSIRYWIPNRNITEAGTNVVRDLLGSDLNPVSGTEEIIATDIIELQFWKVYGYGNSSYIGISTIARKTTLPPQRNITDSMNSTVYLLN